MNYSVRNIQNKNSPFYPINQAHKIKKISIRQYSASQRRKSLKEALPTTQNPSKTSLSVSRRQQQPYNKNNSMNLLKKIKIVQKTIQEQKLGQYSHPCTKYQQFQESEHNQCLGSMEQNIEKCEIKSSPNELNIIDSIQRKKKQLLSSLLDFCCTN